ncbi:unnamed protein product, partial [Mesorhabditis belari]|uniref:Carboxylesterase type B domain-containing protein n=1 Tax=Mesorhabditis belari TaxID=2138241 RepID=A0AAF3F162_9BILA
MKYNFPQILLNSIFLYSNGEGPLVETSYGKLEGLYRKAINGKAVNVFKAVPFAAPPIGDLRWKKPQLPKSWDGVRKATEYSAACMSNSSTTSSPQKWVDEDCLYQNIIVPAGCSKSNLCPVVFYLHGGGINYDSAVMFNDTFLVNNFGGNDVILVITAFRLGFTAVLTFDDDSIVPRNLAIYDILRSLQFVQSEIGNFGGDPSRVTLLGHSMGGGLSFMLTMSKTINPDRKLWQRSIAMSGPLNVANVELLKNLTKEFVYRAGCSPSMDFEGNGQPVEAAMKCLQTKTGIELLAVQRAMEDEDKSKVIGGILLLDPLFPNDGIRDFLQNVPSTDVVMGSNLKEMDRFADDLDPAETMGFKNVKEVNEKYRRDEKNGDLKFSHSTDTQLLFLSNYLCANAFVNSGGTVYLYSFDYPKHPYHTDDLYYIMGIHPFEMDENEKELAKLYPYYFLNFSKTGKPNEEWIPYNQQWDNYLSINVSLIENIYPRNEPDYHKDIIDYWTKEMPAYDSWVTTKKRWRQPEFRVSELADDLKSDLSPCTATVIYYHTGWLSSIIFTIIVFIAGILMGRYTRRDNLEREEYIPITAWKE